MFKIQKMINKSIKVEKLTDEFLLLKLILIIYIATHLLNCYTLT